MQRLFLPGVRLEVYRKYDFLDPRAGPVSKCGRVGGEDELRHRVRLDPTLLPVRFDNLAELTIRDRCHVVENERKDGPHSARSLEGSRLELLPRHWGHGLARQ